MRGSMRVKGQPCGGHRHVPDAQNGPLNEHFVELSRCLDSALARAEDGDETWSATSASPRSEVGAAACCSLEKAAARGRHDGLAGKDHSCQLACAHERRLNSNPSSPATATINTTMMPHGVDEVGSSFGG